MSDENVPDASTAVIRAEWGTELEETPIHFSDQIIGSYRGEYILLSLGQIAQPQFLDGDRAAFDRLRDRGTIPIRTQFRTAIPLSDFAEFLAGMIRVARAQNVSIRGLEDEA